MLTLLSMFSLAQLALPTALVPPLVPNTLPPLTRPASRQIVESQEVRALPGQLDDVPVFNSNSPELIQREGILLSTFPGDVMQVPSAHLNHPLEGRFDIFAHHIARGVNPDDNRTLYFGILVYNPSRQTIRLDSLQAASYLSQEAPFFDLPPYVANPLGTVFSGPGSRTMNDVLRGQRQRQWPASISIPPRRAVMLFNAPIPLRRLTVPSDGTWPAGRVIPVPNPTPIPQPVSPGSTGSASTNSNEGKSVSPGINLSNKALLEDAAVQVSNPLAAQPIAEFEPTSPMLMAEQSARSLPTNGRTVLMHLNSSGPVYMASMAMYAPKMPDGNERVPTLSEWQQILQQKGLAGPRDYPPTPPNAQSFSRFFYGRVSGIAEGSQWVAQLTDNPGSSVLTIPDERNQVSYAVSTVDRNTFGTGQIQSAAMLDRYPDTAYRAHGNYGIKYDLSLPLYNPTRSLQEVGIKFQTPLQNERMSDGLTFLNPPNEQIFFRGTVKLRYTDDWNIPQTRYFHLVQRQGQQGQPLLRLRMQPGERRLVRVEFIYPPDATPPQVLTVETLPASRSPRLIP
ncbi:MAG: DUF3370 domain-containing protein [Elainellaceae cyanobacterium]